MAATIIPTLDGLIDCFVTVGVNGLNNNQINQEEGRIWTVQGYKDDETVHAYPSVGLGTMQVHSPEMFVIFVSKSRSSACFLFSKLWSTFWVHGRK
jgi:hypothetical protein